MYRCVKGGMCERKVAPPTDLKQMQHLKCLPTVLLTRSTKSATDPTSVGFSFVWGRDGASMSTALCCTATVCLDESTWHLRHEFTNSLKEIQTYIVERWKACLWWASFVLTTSLISECTPLALWVKSGAVHSIYYCCIVDRQLSTSGIEYSTHNNIE